MILPNTHKHGLTTPRFWYAWALAVAVAAGLSLAAIGLVLR